MSLNRVNFTLTTKLDVECYKKDLKKKRILNLITS